MINSIKTNYFFVAVICIHFRYRILFFHYACISRKQRMHTHIIVHLYFYNTSFSLGHGLLIHDHLGAMLIAYDLTGGAEVE